MIGFGVGTAESLRSSNVSEYYCKCYKILNTVFLGEADSVYL